MQQGEELLPVIQADRDEVLGEALCGLSVLLRASGFLNDKTNHAAYEQVVAAFNAPIEHTPSDRNAVLEEAARAAGECVAGGGTALQTVEAIRALTTTPEPTGIPLPEMPADHAAELQRIFDQTQKFDPKAVIGGPTPEPTEPAGVAGLADDVERVAKALCEVAQENARRDTGDETLVASYGWQDWIPDAKAAIAALSRTPHLLEVALNQNDAMRQELANVGNLVSDLARAMRVDQTNDDGSWPDLSGRIQKLIDAARNPLLEVAKEALESIRLYANDTLSGRVGGPADAAWYREGIVEVRNRARVALQAIKGAEQ